jgi:uncharacterized protein YwgA
MNMNKSLFVLQMLLCGEKKPVRGKTRLIKLMYITGKELQKQKLAPFDFYVFRKHYYGPYSDELVEDIEKLVENGLVKRDVELVSDVYEENIYGITSKGAETLKNASPEELQVLSFVEKIMERIKGEFNDMPLSFLISDVYAKYPIG